MIIFFLWLFESAIVTLASVVLDEFLQLEEDFPIAWMIMFAIFNIIFTWRYQL